MDNARKRLYEAERWLKENTPHVYWDLMVFLEEEGIVPEGDDLSLEEPWVPTEKARFCNQAGPMGGGCRDSWHVGGNYGSNVCRNPNHHD